MALAISLGLPRPVPYTLGLDHIQSYDLSIVAALSTELEKNK